MTRQTRALCTRWYDRRGLSCWKVAKLLTEGPPGSSQRQASPFRVEITAMLKCTIKALFRPGMSQNRQLCGIAGLVRKQISILDTHNDLISLLLAFCSLL